MWSPLSITTSNLITCLAESNEDLHTAERCAMVEGQSGPQNLPISEVSRTLDCDGYVSRRC